MFLSVSNFSHISRLHISKSKRCFNVKSSVYYFHMRINILADFCICISVPLSLHCKVPTFSWQAMRGSKITEFLTTLWDIGLFSKSFFAIVVTNLITLLKKEEIWFLLIWSVSLSFVIVDNVANPMLMSFNFINVSLLSRSNFKRSLKFLQLTNKSGLNTDCVCKYVIIHESSVNMSLYMKGIIGWSVWYDFKNDWRMPATNEKNWILAVVKGSFTAAFRFS